MTDMVQEVFTNLVNVVMHNNLLQARLARGLSQQELADRAETSGQQISRLEKSERRLTMDWVRRLSRALGCTDAEILGLPPVPVDPVSVRGAIEADKYRSESVWPVDDWYPVTMPEDDRFAGIERYGLEVRDEDARARACQQLSGGATDSRGPTRDHRHPVARRIEPVQSRGGFAVRISR